MKGDNGTRALFSIIVKVRYCRFEKQLIEEKNDLRDKILRR